MQKFQLFTILLVVFVVTGALGYPQQIEIENAEAQTNQDEIESQKRDTEGAINGEIIRQPLTKPPATDAEFEEIKPEPTAQTVPEKNINGTVPELEGSGP